MFNITNIRINGLSEPVGLDGSSFVLSWEVVSDRMDVYLKTVKVFIHDYLSGQVVWENYSTHCDFSMQCSCPLLTERNKYNLVLYISDSYDATARSSIVFTTGLFDGRASFGDAKWLCFREDDAVEKGAVYHKEGKNRSFPEDGGDAAYLFVKDINCGRNVVFAQLNICALGYYELAVNGRKLGDRVLDPAFTVYDRRALYASYDITDLLGKAGSRNRIAVLLGNGFYNSSVPDVWGFHNARWRRRPKFILLADVVYANGRRETFVSDSGFRMHESFIKFQNVRSGELHDMRCHNYGLGYMEPAEDWQNACELEDFSVPRITLQTVPPIKKLDRISPVSVSGNEEECVVRFPENITGWARLQMKGEAGRRVSVSFAERCRAEWPMSISPDVSLDGFVDGPFQSFDVILSGGIDTCEPRFSYNGFQYVIIKGLGYLPEASDITGVSVATDLKPAGDFECSEELFNSIHRLAIRTFRNNFHSIPTDCPQREKNGWTCDGWLASEYGILNFDMQNAYKKWLTDMCDDQYPSGNTSPIVPNCDWAVSEGSLFDVQWSGAMLVIANRLLSYYEDEEVIRKFYPNLERYISYASSFLNSYLFSEGVRPLGDWLDVPPEGTEKNASHCNNTDGLFMNNVFFYRLLMLMTEFCGLAGNDQTEYIRLAENVREAINSKYLRRDGRYFDDSMTSLAMAVCFDLPPREMREAVEKALVEDIERHARHLNTGITGTRYLFDALSKIGRDDLAVAILKQTDYPSYGYMVKNNATTLWEDWKGAASLSHPMLGSVDAWLYKHIGGLDYNRGKLTVRIPPRSLGITRAAAKYHSVYGEIEVSWEYTENVLDVVLEIPVGIETEYNVLGEKHTLFSGSHAFEHPLDQNQ